MPKRLLLPVIEEAERIRTREVPAEKEYAEGVDPKRIQAKYGVARGEEAMAGVRR